MGVYIWKKRLPSAYQEVEYVESSGTQYIKTGLNIYDGYRQTQKVRFLSSSGNIISGGYLGYSRGRFYRFYFGGVNSSGQWSWGYLGDASGEPGHQSGGSGSINTDYELDICWISGNAYYKVDGTALMTSTVIWSSNLAGECCLFGGYAQDSNPNYVPYFGGVRVYYSKFYDSNEVLVRDFVPCYRKSDNVIGMYDLVGETFYTNSGTGTFTKGQDVNYVEHSLKNAYIGERNPFMDYQEVEYIQSDGGQYINTEHKHTANSKVELKLSYQNMTTEWNLLRGSRSSNVANDAFAMFVHWSSNIGASVGGNDFISLANTATDTIYEISLSASDFTINGTSTSLSTNLTSYAYDDLLFTFFQNGSPIGGCYNVKAKMYYCKIYESNAIVMDLVPCYRKSDGVIGMYDLTNDVFYTNQGTGAFTKGPDVN